MADVDFDSLLPVWDGGGTLTVDGAVSVTGISGTVTVDGSGVTQPVSGTVAVSGVSGTVTVDGSGHTQPVSGAVSISGTVIVDGSGQTQPVSGTVAVSGVGGTVIVDGSGHTQPVSGVVSVSNFGNTLEGATLPAGATVIESASLSFGFDGGAGSWQRLKTDGNGALLTSVVGSNANNPVNQHFVFSGGGTGLASSGQAYGEFNPTPDPFFLTDVWGSAAGKMKIELYEGTSGATVIATIQGFTRLMTGFNSTANPNIEKAFPSQPKTTTGNSLYLVVTNKDNGYESIYATLGGWSPLP